MWRLLARSEPSVSRVPRRRRCVPPRRSSGPRGILRVEHHFLVVHGGWCDAPLFHLRRWRVCCHRRPRVPAAAPRRNSTAALSPPVFSSPSPSPPPSPPESAERPSPLSRMSKSFVMKSFDENQDGIIDEAEAAAIAEHLAQQAAAEREAQKEAARERKISQVFRRFALVLLLALLASVGINAGLTAGIVYAVKDTRVGDGAQLADDHGAVIRVSEATAHVPLYTLAAMPLDALGRVHQLSVTYSVRSERSSATSRSRLGLRGATLSSWQTRWVTPCVWWERASRFSSRPTGPSTLCAGLTCHAHPSKSAMQTLKLWSLQRSTCESPRRTRTQA